MNSTERMRIRETIQDIHFIITRFDGVEIKKRDFLNSLERLLDRLWKLSE
jgi:hypothetical protein